MKRTLIAGAFALVSTLALAASWYDSGGTSMSLTVLHWLNGSNVATPVSTANPLPVTTVGGSVPTGTAGSPNAAVVSVQGVAGGTAAPVSGTFWQATQPVSNASLPLPAGAATAAIQSSVIGTIGAGAAATNSLAVGGVFNSTLPTLTNGQQAAVQLDASGRQIVTVAPYAYTPLTPGQHNLAIVASTALTVPTGSTYATVCASTANVKYTTDGTTTPTSTIGMTLSTGACVTLSGATVVANFKAISATGTLDSEFFR